jgi:hypothetical protein
MYELIQNLQEFENHNSINLENKLGKIAIDKYNESTLKSARKRKIIIGALWFVGGIVITIVTYSQAKSEGGGSYLIAWGAIIYGFLQLVNAYK